MAKITGYAALFYRAGNPGTEYELMPGVVERIGATAFRNIQGDDVRGLFNHDPSQVLGRTKAGTMRLSVDSKGLKFEIDAPNTNTAAEVEALIKRGDVTQCSFSFSVKDETWSREGNTVVREIRDLKLFDCSAVTYPAYSATSVSVRSGAESPVDRQRRERAARVREVCAEVAR